MCCKIPLVLQVCPFFLISSISQYQWITLFVGGLCRIFGVETDVEEGGARVMGSASPAARCAVNFFQNHSDPNSNTTSRKLFFFSPFRSCFYDQSQWIARSQLCLICPWHLGVFEVHFVVPVPLGPCIRICSRRTRTCPAIVRSIFWWVFGTHRPCSLERHQISDFLIESMVPQQLALQPLWLSELFVSDQRSAENEVHVSQHGASTSTIASGWCWMKCGGPWSDLDAPIPCFDMAHLKDNREDWD